MISLGNLDKKTTNYNYDYEIVATRTSNEMLTFV